MCADGRIFSTSVYCYWMDHARCFQRVVINKFKMGCRSQSSAQFLSGDQEPWAFRGGLAGEFQRLLPIEGANDLFFQPPPLTPTSKIYTIRPYFPKDEASVYKICREMYDDETDQPFHSQPDLIGDKLVGGLLSLSPDYCFVLEDEDGICGYALGTVDVTPFIKKCKIAWIPFMQEKYSKPSGDKELSEAEKIMLSFHEEQEVLPETFLANFPSLIKMEIHKKVTDPSVAKSMMACLLSSLKANGSRGAFCEVRPDDKRILEFYSKLGCFEIAKMEGFPKDVVILGRSL
uniref:N-acetyltransferase domain-containing protein n=1 Tax=Micrurus corallinus TaxID=54390 RepID=A0A2D4FU48_MICCO